jgi:hypothetical protein
MSDEVTAQPEVVAETKPAPVVETKPVVVGIGLQDAAAAIAAAAVQGLEVRKTSSDSYRIIGTKKDGEVNWRKGLIYVVNSYMSGLRIELQLYSSKKGAHLAEYKDRFNQFAGKKIGAETIEQLPFGLATRLRVKLPYVLGLDGVAKAGAEFIELVDAEVEAVRALITLPEKAKKAKKEAAPKTQAEPAEGKAAAKRVAKSKSKTKAPAPVAAVAEAPVVDAGVNEAIAEIAPPTP